MDDDHKANNAYIISTKSYSLEDVNLLCEVLLTKYGISANPKKTDFVFNEVP